MPATFSMIDLKPLMRWLTPDDMRRAGERLFRLQQARIDAGGGTRGKMKGYSAGYKKKLAAAGEPTTPRDLRRTGKMLNSRAVMKFTATSATIGFSPREAYMYINQARTPFTKPTKEERADTRAFLIQLARDRSERNLETARSAPKVTR